MSPRAFAAAAFLVSLAPRLHAQPVGSEFRANTTTTGDQTNPAVGGASGSFVVVWVSPDGDGTGIFGQRFSTASKPVPLGAEFRVNTTTTGTQDQPAVASDANGDFVVVWQSFSADNLRTDVLAQRYAATGAPAGGEFRVNTYTTVTPPFLQRHPAVSSDPAGSFVVAWTSYHQDGNGYGVFAQRYAAAGAAVDAEFRVNTYTTYAQRDAAVAHGGDGTFVVVWQGVEGGPPHVYGQRYAASGAPLGGEFAVSQSTVFDQSSPAVAADASGNFLAAWESPQDGFGQDVFARRFAASGAPLVSEFRVNTLTNYAQVKPRAASESAGSFTVVWQSYDAAGHGITTQRYASSGAPIGGEFVVNSYQTGFQYRPAIAAVGAGFVDAWDHQNGTPFDVFGKKFPGPGDINGDGVVNVADVFYLINFLFAQGASPIGPADTNGNGTVDVADVFYLINYLFAQGAFPK
jgi:hypothetical protein